MIDGVTQHQGVGAVPYLLVACCSTVVVGADMGAVNWVGAVSNYVRDQVGWLEQHMIARRKGRTMCARVVLCCVSFVLQWATVAAGFTLYASRMLPTGMPGLCKPRQTWWSCTYIQYSGWFGYSTLMVWSLCAVQCNALRLDAK